MRRLTVSGGRHHRQPGRVAAQGVAIGPDIQISHVSHSVGSVHDPTRLGKASHRHKIRAASRWLMGGRSWPGDNAVVIKRIKKGGHGGHHGGALESRLCRLRHGDDGLFLLDVTDQHHPPPKRSAASPTISRPNPSPRPCPARAVCWAARSWARMPPMPAAPSR